MQLEKNEFAPDGAMQPAGILKEYQQPAAYITAQAQPQKNIPGFNMSIKSTPMPEGKILEKIPYQFFKEDINVNDLTLFKSWVEQLEKETPKTIEELELFIKKVNELNNKLGDTGALIYIKMTSNTADKEIADLFNKFQQEVQAYYSPKSFLFSNIILNSPAFKEWSKKHGVTGELFRKIVSNDRDLFREKNVPLTVKESELEVQYRSIVGNMTIKFQGEEKTMSEMGVFLKNKDRSIREAAWKARMQKMQEHKKELNSIFDQMYSLRQEIAKNAGFKNYRDYMHQAKGRFSYSVKDVLAFHEAIEHEIVPLIAELNQKRKEILGIDTLRPWDTSVSLDGKILKPVEKPEDLIPKNTLMMAKIDPLFGEQFASMNKTKLLDLFNRKNKAPGGYNYPLSQYGASFIFMNAVGIHSDLTTLVHEAGHAMHSFAKKGHPYTSFLGLPMEAAELASMSMEMISMDQWKEFYTNPKDLQKAKFDQLEGALRFFPWCSIIDSFQQEIYTSADTAEKRAIVFKDLMKRYSEKAGTDWSGLDQEKEILWMFQLHVFEVPFYYIEYGISQLGAIAMYRQYKQDPVKTIENYKKFLNSGHQKPLAELYKEAGIELKFDRKYIKELADFVRKEIQEIEKIG